MCKTVLDVVQVTKNFNAKNSCDRRTYEYLTPTFVFQETNVEPVELKPENINRVNCEPVEHFKVDPQVWKNLKAYRMNAETLEKLRETLTAFEGTNNFHNFTLKLPPYSPKYLIYVYIYYIAVRSSYITQHIIRCKRYIMRFESDEPFLKNGVEWIRLRVIGQSFLLHHIRKMIGTYPIRTIAIYIWVSYRCIKTLW